MSLRILVADQDEIIRELLAGLIAAHPGWETCGTAATPGEAVEKTIHVEPDLVLLDIGLAFPGGLGAARQIVEKIPSQKIIVLGFDDSQAGVREAFEAGALGYVLKAHAARDLVSAVQALEDGRTYFTPRLAETMLREYVDRNKQRPPGDSGLDDRQRQAVKFLAREAATTITPPPRRAAISQTTVKKLAIVAAIAISAGFAWTYYRSTLEEKLPVIDNVLENSGLKAPPPAPEEGNPDVKVWIDLQTGLYYCPGDKAYRKTPKGRLAKQHDARMDQFQPANRKPCE